MRALLPPAGLAAAALALLAAAAAPLGAQQEAPFCLPTERLSECYGRALSTGNTSAAAAAADTAISATGKLLREKTTGPSLPSVAEAASAIQDFLPKLAAALITPAAGEGPQALGLKANLPFNDGILFNWGMTAQLGATFHDPQPFAPLVDSIPAGLRDGARERLAAGLEPYDDVGLRAALNLENRRLGRSLRSHQDVVRSLAREVLQPLASGRRADRRASTITEFVIAVRTLVDSAAVLDARRRAPECSLEDRSNVRLDCLAPATRAQVDARIRQIGRVSEAWRAAAVERIRESGFSRLAQLVNNQPQLSLAAEGRVRRDVVGPDEWRGRGRFEMGFANMNGLRRHCGAQGIRAACLQTYTESPAVRRSLARGDRVWAEVDAARRMAWDVRLPGDSVELSLEEATSFTVAGGYGAYFGNVEDGDNRDRFDLQGRYDLTGDDPLRQDRFVATAFYTRRVSGQASAVLGLTWANRPEFLGEVDRKFGAHLGFSYKLHQQDAEEEGGGAEGGAGGNGGGSGPR